MRYVAIGFRSLINTYTELIKTAGIYEGLANSYPNLHSDPIYLQKDFFTNYLEYIKQENLIRERLENPPLVPDEDGTIYILK